MGTMETSTAIEPAGGVPSGPGAAGRPHRRDLIAVVIILLCLLCELPFIALAIRPQWQHRNALAVQLAAAEERMQETDRLSTDLESQLHAAQARRDEVAGRFLDPSEAADWLRGMRQRADQSGIDLLSLHWEGTGETERDTYAIWTFRLRGRGSLSQLTAFLSAIEEAAPTGLQITEVSIAEAEMEDERRYALAITIRLYTIPHGSAAPIDPADLAFERIPPTPSPTPTPTRTMAEQLESDLDQAWQAKDWEQALHLVQQLLDLNPGDETLMDKLYATHVNYGHHLAAQGKWEEAKRAYSAALHIRPGRPEAPAGLRHLSSGWTPSSFPTSTTDYVVHVVRAGDNLFRIALRYGVSVDALRIANGLTGSTIYVGQRLHVPIPAR